MRRVIAGFICAAVSVVLLCASVFAVELEEADYRIDAPEGTFTDSEYSSLGVYAQKIALETGFNIVILVSDDVGSDKSDYGVADYADVYYENVFGKDTTGILLLINNDTKYDYISTSGLCILYFTDARIDRVFDEFYDDIIDGNYYQAATKFLTAVKKQYDSGISSNQHTVDYGSDYKPQSFDNGNVNSSVIFIGIFVGVTIGAIVAIMIYGSNKLHYTKLKKFERWSYISPLHTSFTESSTQKIRSYTVTTNSSSGGGGGGRSSSHRSSGGGHHGGGGRHR